MTNKKYDESSIERFAGLAGIRKKSTVYIGPNDSNGLWTIWREPADNSVDRALAGDNTLVHLIADVKPNVYWVLDAGPGIPVGKKEFEDERGRKEKLSTLYVTTGLTHGGGNFSGTQASRGTHGIGIKATNAMSKAFSVWTFREGSWWCIDYADAKIVKEPYKCKAPPKLPHGIKVKKGTVIRFEPDLSLFTKDTKMQMVDIKDWCQLTAYLVPKLEVKYTNSKGKTLTIVSKRGVLDFIDKRVEDLKCTVMTKKVVHFSTKEVDVALTFTDAEGANLISAYTNGLWNRDGGNHVEAVTDALVKSLKPYKGKLEYTPTDLKDGLLGLVNAKLAAPKFSNQRKDKLDDERVYDDIHKQALAEFATFWTANKSLAVDVQKRAALLRTKTAEFLKDKKLIKNVKNAGSGLASKLAGISANSKVPLERRELYLVEGDSAGGVAEIARFKDFQATFKTKGKPLNVMEATKDAINKNAEIAALMAAIGLDMTKPNPLDHLKYGRIIYLADPDVDGKHIQCLFSAIFWKFLPQLFKRGQIFIVKSPEYMAKYKGKVVFGDSKNEVYTKAGTKKIDIRHIKGWAEVNEEAMREIAFEIGKRHLLRVNPPKDKAGNKRFEALMGKNAEFRKKLLGVV
jgi:DNA gyrase/topoisomerase IV subunit B